MLDRQEHQQEVRGFFQKLVSARDWVFSLPPGSGTETYFVQGSEQSYFVKVGAPVDRYLAMAEIGLTPPVLSFGQLESGPSILIQPRIPGRTPSRVDFQNQLERVATLIQKMHTDFHIRSVLPPALSDLHKDSGIETLKRLRQKWERYKDSVPYVSAYVDESLEKLTIQIHQFTSAGLAACHNDICNANWLFAQGGQIYLVDLESMSLEDPALDLGALLWWYYPPQQRERFLELAGYPFDLEFKARMRVRMALHCLHIALPREQSFDEFEPQRFQEVLKDFRAVVEGKENPQGYTA